MKVTLDEAYSILKLPYGSKLEEVHQSCKRLFKQHKTDSDYSKLLEYSCAYKRITGIGVTDEIEMDMESMRVLMKKILNYGGNSVNNEDIDDEDDDDSSDSEECYAEAKSEKIANDLITEEEKEKRRAEKRRAKKKKRKERKRLEKEQEQTTTNNISENKSDSHNGVRSSDEGEGIDPNAAFVKKSKKKSDTSSHKADARSSDLLLNNEKNDSSLAGDSSAVIDIAIRGNQKAVSGDYPAAIKLFSDAIKLEPSDFRFFGNRSYCYDRIMQFEKALADADKCIELSSEWPKGYFRKGRALAGLKLFQDAERAFMQVLKLDRNCEEAQKELVRVRTQQLIDMGFSPKQAEEAVLASNSLQQALDSLLANVGADITVTSEDVYVSDDEYEDQQQQQQQQQLSTSKIQTIKNKVKLPATRSEQFYEEKKMDPTNPDGLTALWVGNVVPTVKESDLQKLFSRYGPVSSVRCLHEKYCAFVNFRSKEAAGKAMNALQNHEVQGQNLLIKFPDNPMSNGNSVTKNPKPQPNTAITDRKIVQAAAAAAAVSPAGPKVSGPVNGDECYFWRTTGCQFGDKCRYKHIKENRSVDKKPWQKVK